MSKTALVLEGGAMRGNYTSGVLDFFIDKDINFDYVIGVSAGAANGCSYISRQRGRSFRINTNYLNDKRYLSFSNLVKNGSLFGMEFLFEKVPKELDIFDYESFLANKSEFITGVTNIETGETEYYGKQEKVEEECTLLRASCAIPVFSNIVEFKGKKYVDGGTSDSIPIRKALSDGCDKAVIVLTRNRGFVKKPEGMKGLYKKFYKEYPAIVDVLNNRHNVYNETLSYIETLEKEGRVIVIAPSEEMKVSRFEKNIDNLKKIYDNGMSDASNLYERIAEFIS